jgi:hypothetical protein
MAAVTAIVAGVGMAASAVSGAVAANKAKKAAGGARNDKNAAEAELQAVKDARQDVINPYDNTKNLSDLAQDLSGQMTNPFEQLGVATQAAEIQMEQTDIALANTLDNLRATGASAGGATALAQAALQSKRSIAANIEQQEANNDKMRAQGEQALQQQKLSEQQRLQGIAIAEGQREQAALSAGRQFEFQAAENRTNMDLDRAAGKISQASANEASANQAKAAAWGGVASSIGGIASSAAGRMGG